MEITAAVLEEPGQPLAIEQIEIDEPGDREILVRTVASGVCHSDLHVLRGSVYAGRGPHVLGHEGAGIVEATGPGVTHVAPGDRVVTCLSGFCGQCEQCLSGHPNLCAANPTARPRGAPPRLTRGDQRLRPLMGIASFAERMLLHEHSVVRIDEDVPLDVACLVGCGVLTGVGAALRTARIEVGQAVAVFGCGGVGLSIIQGAVLAGAGQVIAVDRVAAKLELARSLGATDTVEASAGTHSRA
jgi:S-(hydroxymethyl)glutathione dehydrogenase/alcohol dehydrogenase